MTKPAGSRRNARTRRTAGMAASHPAVDTTRRVRADFSDHESPLDSRCHAFSPRCSKAAKGEA